MKKQTLSRYLQPAIILLWAMACFCFFQLAYKYHFYYQEQTQLFLNSTDYAASYLSRPAWMACLVGDFLTQFYYFTYAGPLILTLALATLGDLLRRSLERAGLSRWAFVAAIVGMTVVFVFCFNERYRLSSVIALIGGAAGFWLATLLCSGLPQVFRKKSSFSSVFSLLFLLCSPLVVYWCFGSGLWLYALLAVAALVFKREKRPAVGAAVALALVPLCGRVYTMTYADLYNSPMLGSLGKPGIAVDKELAVITEYGLGNHNRAAKLVEQEQTPTPTMKFYYNLVMAERDCLPDSLLKWTNNNLGTFAEISSDTPTLTIYSLNDLYWLLGDMTYTERAAMLANVFSPENRNVKMTKRLAEVNLVTGDRAAACKYLRLLAQTVAYRQWAEPLLRGDDAAALAPYHAKAALTNRLDTLQAGQNMHTVMMQLLDSNPKNTVALDYALCSLLLLKDIDGFKRDYDRYCMATQMPRAKKLYQEALCIWLAGKNATEEEWARYISDATVARRFVAYNQQRGSADFRDTYWYYFDRAPQISANTK